VDTQDIINSLEKALEAARAGRLADVGQLVTKASDAAGVPHNLLQLARETRAKGFVVEADLLTFAIDVAASAEKRGQVYERTLGSLHDLACERLAEIHDEKHKGKQPSGGPPRTVSRLN
jgi:hypothetical protein